MFATTFLGHQGWVFQSDHACILVDPLLCEDFGELQRLEYRVYPPRIFDWERFPKISALVLSHEHDDHFDLPSLNQLDRRIPVLLSARSSTAAYRILTEMGFSVQPLLPGMAFGIADLEILTLCGDHVRTPCGDEWDTLPFVIRQADGDGSFFSMVDIPLTPEHIQMARNYVPRPGLIGWTNNAMDWSHMASYKAERTEGTAEATLRMQAGLGMLLSGWGPPAAMLMCAGGFAFTGERAWLNRQVFCVDTEQVCKTLGQKLNQLRFYSTRPGQTVFMEGNRIKRVEKLAPFLSTTPPPSWPLRTRAPDREISDYGPATGRRDFDAKDLDRLRRGLGELAGALFGGTLFKSLYSMLGMEAEGRASTFALVLRSGDDRQAMIFEYDPTDCSFDAVAADAESGPRPDPRQHYLAGLECWATDLLAILEGQLGPIAINFGRARLWNALPQRFNFAIFDELYRLSHPLRRPDDTLRVYQQRLAQLAPTTPRILPRENP